MKNAPLLAERVIVSDDTTPPFTAPVVAINGFDEQLGAFSVTLVLPCDVAKYTPFFVGDSAYARRQEEAQVVALVRQRGNGSWTVVNPLAAIAVGAGERR